MESYRFLLSEKGAQLLVAPLGLSGRIRYTCVALSDHFIALGANTGGVYCFHRDCRYIQLLANKEGPVSILRISADEQSLAVVAGGGWLVLWELRLSGNGVCKRVYVCGLLKEALIKDVVWEEKRGRVFFGDSLGRVAQATLPKLSKKPNLLRRPNEVIFQEKSAVVQLDLHGDILLVCTLTRVVLLPLALSRTGIQVGKKPRDGQFGACLDEKAGQLVVYSARPGGRLWEAGAEGDVQSTVKMRELLTCPPSPILGHGFSPSFARGSLPLPVSLSLPYLLSLHDGSHLITWDDTGLYLWRPLSWKLSVWTKELGSVVDLAACVSEAGITLCTVVEQGKKVVIMSTATLLQSLQWLLREGLNGQAKTLLFANMAEAVQLLFSSASLRVSLLITTKPTITDTHSLQILTLKSLIQYINEGEASQKGALEENMCVTVETRAEGEVEKGIEEVAHNARYDASTVNTTHARVYHRSNSWDGVSQQCLTAWPKGDGVGLWSHSSLPSLAQVTSQEAVSAEAHSLGSSSECLVEPPATGLSLQQPQLANPLLSTNSQDVEPDDQPHSLRTSSLQSMPPIAMATLPDHDTDDVIAVPVRGSMAVSDSSKPKRKARRTKKSSSVAPEPSLSAVPEPPLSAVNVSQSQAVGTQSLVHIPEDTPTSTDPELIGGHQIENPDPHIRRSASFMSKMKELAKHGGQNIGFEADTLQEAFQQPVKKVKELLSSLATPVPTALSLPETVFVNEEFANPQTLPEGEDQSGCTTDSHDLPQSSEDMGKSKFTAATESTKLALAMPHVYCSSQAIKDTMNNWIVAVESSNAGMAEYQSDLLTLCLEAEVYGAANSLVPFLSRYSKLLNGLRTMRILGMQPWSVREECWMALAKERGTEPALLAIETVTSQTASAADLPSFLSSLAASDPDKFVTVCVKAWPAVRAWQVALTCSFSQSETSAGEADGGLGMYADYLSQLLEAGHDRELLDQEMLLVTLQRLLAAGPSLHLLQTEDGQPRPWSHQISWPYSDLLHQLVGLCVSMKLQHLLTEASSLCERFGYWLGVVRLAVATGSRGKGLFVVLCLRDATLLKGSPDCCVVMETTSEWQEALQMMNNLTTHTSDRVTAETHTSDWVTAETHTSDRVTAEELTRSELVRQLVATIGPRLATRVISSVGVARGGDSAKGAVDVHSLLVQLAHIHSQQKRVSQSLLEKVDRYLWSRRPVAVSAELEETEERERDSRKKGQPEEQVQSDVQWRPTLEDCGRHWGVWIGSEGRCGTCSSSLSRSLSANVPGLVLFPCGHAYHRCCLPEMACSICFQKNFSEHVL